MNLCSTKNVTKILQELKIFARAKIELITNGDVLNLKNITKLFDAGLSTLLISVYDGPEDMDKFKKMCQDAKLNPDQYVIRNRYLPLKKIMELQLAIEVV